MMKHPLETMSERDSEIAAIEKEIAETCMETPLGWRCTRKAGHEGPCAAVPCPEDTEWVQKGMGRLRKGGYLSAPVQEPVPIPEMLRETSPERIWLGLFTDDEDANFPSDHEGVCWAESEFADLNVQYIRADLAVAHPAQTKPPLLTDEEVGQLTVFAGLHDIETTVLAEFIRAIERVVRRQFRQTQPAPVQEPSDSDYATIAGLDASIGHLSRLVDEQRKLLVRCADVFGVDRFGIPFEDGDSELIDRVREMVATTTSPTAIQWPKARDVGRYGDMSQEAHMRVGLDSDNDVFVSVWDGAGGATVEFCTPGAGGGKSSETRMALIALMVAMEKDNARTPRLDWWAQRMGAAKG